MQPQKLLHKLLKKTLPQVHSKRLTALTNAVEALLKGKRLTLTALGRALSGPAKERHCIRKIDRLLGNKKLHQEENTFYKAMSFWLIRQNPERLLINVDWSCVNKRKDWHILRASVALNGRSQVLYQEVHPQDAGNSPHVQKIFLKHLKEILPRDARAVLITDAGFQGPWFVEAKKQGFDWIGRVRNQVCYRTNENSDWKYTYDLYDKATSKAQLIEDVTLSKRTSLNCRFILFKKIKKRRLSINRSGNRMNNNASNRCARRERDPWLLATSLPVMNIKEAKKIVIYYQKRMQIEEDFRDTKSHQFGFGLRYSLTNNDKRLQILLLIAALASLMCWLISLSALQKRLQFDYQANSIKHRTVLSVTYLACQLVRREIIFSEHELMQSFIRLQQIIQENALC